MSARPPGVTSGEPYIIHPLEVAEVLAEMKLDASAIAAGLLLTVILWGGNNAGTKWLVAAWPPVFTGMTRFLFAGIILLAVLRFTNLLGEFQPLAPAQRRWRGRASWFCSGRR